MKEMYSQLKASKFIFNKDAPDGASYIMNDGLFLHLEKSPSMKKFFNRRPTHIDFYYVCLRLGFKDVHSYDALIRSDNAIRINNGIDVYFKESAYIEMPSNKPTKEQFDSLLLWMDISLLKTPKIDVSFVDRDKLYSFKSDTLADDIIKVIKREYEIQS